MPGQTLQSDSLETILDKNRHHASTWACQRNRPNTYLFQRGEDSRSRGCPSIHSWGHRGPSVAWSAEAGPHPADPAGRGECGHPCVHELSAAVVRDASYQVSLPWLEITCGNLWGYRSPVGVLEYRSAVGASLFTYHLWIVLLTSHLWIALLQITCG